MNKIMIIIAVIFKESLLVDSLAWAETAQEWMELAKKAQIEKNYKTMVRAYKRASRDPAYYDQAITSMSQAILTAGDVNTAIRVIGAYIHEENPFSIEGQLIYAEALRQNGDYTGSMKALDIIQKVRPNYPPVLEIRGLVFYDAHQYDDAIVNLSAFIAVHSDATRARNARAHSYFELNRLKEASIDFKILLSHNSKISQNWVFLGDCYLGMNIHADAESAYMHAKKLDPNNSDIYRKLAGVNEKNSDIQKSFFDLSSLYKTSIQLNPKNFDAGQRLGILLLDNKMYNLAESEFRRELQLDPSYDPAIKGLIKVLTESKHLDQIAPLLKSYTDRFPERTWASIQYTQLLLSINQFSLAKKVIDRNRSATDENLESVIMLANW